MPFFLLLIFFPISLAFYFRGMSETWIFISSSIAIIPLAAIMGEATEHLSARVGHGIGALLNATFGNATELIIALIALHAGLYEVVKASITGSIIGNILLVLGTSIVVGGFRHKEQFINIRTSSMCVGLLGLASVSLLMPTIFHMVVAGIPPAREHILSVLVAGVLFLCYLFYLLFSLVTHRDFFRGEESSHLTCHETWSTLRASITLGVATIGVAIVSELLVGSIEPVVHTWGLTDIFVGVFVLAILGNVAEHSTAVTVAFKNQMELSFQIAIGSSAQIALLVTPILIFASHMFGLPMDLVFDPLEAVAIVLSVGSLAVITQDGRTNWMEGVLLIGTYCILGISFYFHP